MKDSRHTSVKLYSRCGYLGKSGVAALELAIILPLMLILVLWIIDFGRLISARLVITNLAREGGGLATREIRLPTGVYSAWALIPHLQKGASSLDLANSGKIYIWKINAGTSANHNPAIDYQNDTNGKGLYTWNEGNLSVSSSIGDSLTNLGLSSTMYNHLMFNDSINTSDISNVTVVEVFYRYTPITPISKFIPGLMTSSGSIIHSRAVF